MNAESMKMMTNSLTKMEVCWFRTLTVFCMNGRSTWTTKDASFPYWSFLAASILNHEQTNMIAVNIADKTDTNRTEGATYEKNSFSILVLRKKLRFFRLKGRADFFRMRCYITKFQILILKNLIVTYVIAVAMMNPLFGQVENGQMMKVGCSGKWHFDH